MREFKFRCWNGIEMTSICYKPCSIYDTHIVMQYTGLKDRNNKEIYEGDIVKDHREILTDFSIRVVNEYVYNTLDKIRLRYHADGSNDKWLEVIGNIYENKELLND